MSLAIDPNTTSTTYAAAGAVFKSTDNGASWMVSGSGLPNAPVASIAIDPRSPTTLYAGLPTGLFGIPGPSVFKSTDGAASWRASSPFSEDGYEAAFVVATDPLMPNTVYVGVGAAVFKSSDAGQSWSNLSAGLSGSSGIPGTLVVDPKTPGLLYYATSVGVFVMRQSPPSATPIPTLAVTPTANATGTPVASPTSSAAIVCVGDCDGNDRVLVDELVKGVNIALGNAPLDNCPAFDCNGNGRLTVDCLVKAVNNALSGCPR